MSRVYQTYSTESGSNVVGEHIQDPCIPIQRPFLQQDTDDVAPTSFAEALAAVAAREETRRRGFQSKSVGPKRGSKLKPGSSLVEPGFPGAVPGGEAERSAFWMVMEVCPRGITF